MPMTSTFIAGFGLETWHGKSFKTTEFESWIRGCGWGCRAMICQMPDVTPCPKARAWANNWKKSRFSPPFSCGWLDSGRFLTRTDGCARCIWARQCLLMPFKATMEAMVKMDCEVWEPPVKFGKNHDDSFQTFLHFSLLRKAQWVQPSAVNGCVDYSQGWQIMQQITA